MLDANRLNAMVSRSGAFRSCSAHTPLKSKYCTPLHPVAGCRAWCTVWRGGPPEFAFFCVLHSPFIPPPQQYSYPRGAEYGAVALRGRRVHRLRQTFVSKIKILDSGARDRPLENVNNNKRKK